MGVQCHVRKNKENSTLGPGGWRTRTHHIFGRPRPNASDEKHSATIFQRKDRGVAKFTIDCDLYLAKLSAKGNIFDELKLKLLEPFLNETERGELQFMIRISARQLNFQHFLAKLAARYGEEANACAWRRWREFFEYSREGHCQ